MRLSLIVVAAAFLTVPADLASQETFGDVEFSLLGVWHNKTTVFDANRGVGVGMRIGVTLPAYLEIEGQIDNTWTRVRGGDRFRLRYTSAQLLYNLPLLERQAYVAVGYGKFVPDDCYIGTARCGNFGANALSAGARVPIRDRIRFRIDGTRRARSTYDYSGVRLSMGVSVLLRKAQGGPSIDTDLDGVYDYRDQCPATPAGALVDQKGCPGDHDGDGVYDGIDRCPKTPPGSEVNVVGCSEEESRSGEESRESPLSP